MTISEIAVPLKVGAAMAAEVLGVCVLTSVLDLILCQSLSVQNINKPDPPLLTDRAGSLRRRSRSGSVSVGDAAGDR